MGCLVEASSSERPSGVAGLRRVELGLELPAQVSVAAVAIDDPDAVLALLDGSALAQAVPSSFVRQRRAEFLAGRHAAASALLALGLPTSVARAPSGLPTWPEGGVGSIAHGAGVACALAARRADCNALGVDVERPLEEAEAAALAPAIAHADELLLLRAALPHTRGGERLSVVFSAKQSLFKCLFPLTHTFLEFSDARVVSVGMTSRQRGLLAIRLERACGGGFPRGRILQARFALGPQRAASAVLLFTE